MAAVVALAGRRATIVLALVLVAVFVLEVADGAAGNERALVAFGALFTRGWSGADAWRVLTFSFLHLNALHLTLNTAGLLWLGGIVERRSGSLAMLTVFAGSAVMSGAAAMLLGPFLPTSGVAVGASGAIYGLLAAALMLAFHRSLVICLIAATAISFLPGVSLAGHLGGLAGGALLAVPFRARARIRADDPARLPEGGVNRAERGLARAMDPGEGSGGGR